MGVECASVPSSADHLMFWPVLRSKDWGKPRSPATMLRDQAWPHWGWSEARSGKHGDSRSTIQRSGKEQVPNGRMSVAISSWLVDGASLERGNWSLELLVRVPSGNTASLPL